MKGNPIIEMNREKARGFTLIELLVVISIIALLSTIVFAAVSSARQKGNVAAGQSFDGSTYSGFFGSLSVEWNFDTNTTSIADQSGNGNTLNLTPSGSTVVPSPNPFNQGYVLAPGTIGTLTSSALNNIPVTSDFTVSFWFYSTSPIDTYEYLSDFSGLTNQSFKFDPHDQSNFYFDFRTANTIYPASAGTLVPGKWYQFVGVCSTSSGTPKIVAYVNGQQIGTPVILNVSGSKCGITSNPIHFVSGPTYYIDNVRIYQQAFPLSVIQEQYYAELPKVESFALNSK